MVWATFEQYQNLSGKNTALRRRSQRIRKQLAIESRAQGAMAGWDLIGVNHAGMILVCESQGDWPEERVRENLYDCLTPTISAKLIHRWTGSARWPYVRMVP